MNPNDRNQYRYTLTREWSTTGTVVPWIMLNPSTADANTDDPTIRRVISFSKAIGPHIRGLIVVNLFPYRATNPADLVKQPSDVIDPPANFHIVSQMLEHSKRQNTPIVCAWGSQPIARDAAKSWCRLMKNTGVSAVCLGKNKDGSPRHPLYVPANTRFRPYI